MPRRPRGRLRALDTGTRAARDDHGWSRFPGGPRARARVAPVSETRVRVTCPSHDPTARPSGTSSPPCPDACRWPRPGGRDQGREEASSWGRVTAATLATTPGGVTGLLGTRGPSSSRRTRGAGAPTPLLHHGPDDESVCAAREPEPPVHHAREPEPFLRKLICNPSPILEHHES